MTVLKIPATAAGKMRVQIKDAVTGETRFDSGLFSNMLLNSFFNVAEATLSYCFASTDSTPPAAGDSTVLGNLGSTNNVTTSAIISVEGTKTVVTQTRTCVFNAGAIVGNLASIYMGNNLLTSCVIKALVKDVNGDPTVIPVTATDQLIVTHVLAIKWEQYENLGTYNQDGVDYLVEMYNTTVNVQTTVNSPGLLRVAQGGGYWYRRCHASFTPPSMPQATPSATTLVTGLSTGLHASTSAGPSFLGGVGVKESYWTYNLAANQNINTSDPIAAISEGYTTTGNASLVFAFTPALPKNNTIAYTFRMALNLSRE